MELIPVIDLMGGLAVMARGGNRESYRPLQTPLCPSGDPLTLVESFLACHPFKTLYIADLDAILNQGDNGIIIAAIRRRFPQLTLWIDRGWPPYPPSLAIVPVIGSESLPQAWRPHLARLPSPWILSLDFGAQGFIGPEDLLASPQFWSDRVIVMSLTQVGGSSGPDWQRLRRLTRRHPGIEWIAAGGIRNQADLAGLRRLNVHRALVATALHQGNLLHQNKSHPHP